MGEGDGAGEMEEDMRAEEGGERTDGIVFG